MKNILLEPFSTLYQAPPFDLIKDEDFLPAFQQAIKETEQEIEKIAENAEKPTFENTIEALEYAGQKLRTISRIFFNLNHAHTNETIQQTARTISPELTKLDNDIWLNKKLFERVKAVWENTDREQLREDQIKLLNDVYDHFARKGALLKGDEQAQYRDITTELAKLSLQFGENVLAETNDFQLHITDQKDLKGLPDGVLEAAAALAKSQNKEGWLFTLHFPSYMPFMKYAENRALRKKMYLEYAKRGNRNNEHDNKEVIKKIVSGRVKKAKLLGFSTHADFVLVKSMAASKNRVTSFLDELLEASLDFGKKDVKEVEAFAQKHGLKDRLQAWDYAFYSEKLKKETFDIDDESIRPYFILENVEKGVFGLAGKLYGLSFKENTQIPKYHDEVKVFEVHDNDGSFLGLLYLDYFPRSSKQGGAWMTAYREQYIDRKGNNIRPLISLVMNFTKPTKSKPSLLSYMEVRTFLHEFGHALHGMLSNVHYESQSGTSVYRDFVELPSQIMENWGMEKAWLKEVGVHYQTGATIPDELIDKLIASGKFQSGYSTVRQLSFGMNDMAWHTLEEPFQGDVIAFERKATRRTRLFPPVEGTAVSTAFSHIFDGGYAAGYYGYKWAEVLDADAFELFKEKGIFNREVAGSFRKNILEKGGTKHPMDLYKAFRGHEPDIKPLLKRSGLIKEEPENKTI